MEPTHILLTFGDEEPSSRNISWQCDSVLHTSYVELTNLADSTTKKFDAYGEIFRSRSGVSAYYVVRLRNLEPNAHYAYRVVTDEKASKWFDFHVGGSDTTHVSFIYVGDVQDTVNGLAPKYLQAAVRNNPESEFVICGGDLVERPTQRYWNETFRDVDSIAQHLPLMNITGNHDYLKGPLNHLERRFPLVFSYFLDSKIDENMVYTFCYGPAQFFFLDSHRALPYLITQRNWLKEKLKQSTAKWKIVVLHHPLYSAKSNYNNLTQRLIFNGLISDNKVDLVLQ